MIFILVISLFAFANSIPLETRCFQDGMLVVDQVMSHGIAEICVKDDVSIIKTISQQQRNTTLFSNRVYRKMLVQNYEDCNPVEVPNGPIMIFKPDRSLMLIPHTFACRTDCTISLDSEEANIILHSDKLNHYEVMGTTTATRWFQGSTTYSLEHTCEHIQVTCGSKSLNFHACFKYHMACIRFMNRSYMPAFIIKSVCQNKELIIMCCLVLIIFSLLYIMTLTYICYILIPIFYPLTYLYGILYNKSCKKCYYCGLAYHPFSKCGKNCVCGSMFENSERMKMHRESGLCKGYKSLRAARILCKNKGSSFGLALALSFLLLSFVQPIESMKLKYEQEVIEIDEVTEEFDLLISKVQYSKETHLIFIGVNIAILVMILLFVLLKSKIEDKLLNKYIFLCDECQMTHPRKGLRFFFNGIFTNKCNTCMCGCNYNEFMTNTDDDYTIPMTHTLTAACYTPARYYVFRKVSNCFNSVVIGTLIILILVSISAAANNENCIKPSAFRTVTDPIVCSAWMNVPSSCTEPPQITSLFGNNVHEIEVRQIEPIKSDLHKLLEESEKTSSPLKAYLLEEAAVKLHCQEISGFNTETGKFNSELKKQLAIKQLEVCSTNKADKACKCFIGDAACDTSDALSDMVTYYKANKQVFKNDLQKIIAALSKVYPGLLAKEFNLAMKHSNLSQVKVLAEKLKSNFGNAKAACSVINILIKSLADAELNAINPKTKLLKDLPEFEPVWKTESIFKTIHQASAIKTCVNFKFYQCRTPLSSRLVIVLTCNNENNKFYKVPDQGYSLKHASPTTLCVGDPYCELEFIPVQTNEKNDLESMACTQIDNNKIDNSKMMPITKCKKVSTQTCVYQNLNKTFMECSNGYFYEYYQETVQSGKDEIGISCFDKGCKQKSFPHHVSNLKGCVPHVANMTPRKLKQIVYENIEQLKHSIQETIKTDLIEHKYKLTMNLPHISPSFRTISIQGTETDSGIENSYIETNVIVRSGSSVGVTLSTKKGEKLFDLVIFVKNAFYESIANPIYTTGPTVGINVEHNEQCTGTCPTNLKKQGWLSFQKEHTSSWGCEEFGCLAIGAGCVYGHCRDIIRPEMKIFKLSTEEQPRVNVCISMPDSSYCHEINSFTPIITDQIEVQFLSNEAGRIPKIFAYKSHKVLTGMINDFGSFSKMCGSVQQVEKEVFGAGIPRWDYICHAASRKDIVVSKCYDNFYDSCLKLSPEENLVFDDQTNKIIQINRLLGEIRLKIKLGDITYKLFEKNPSFDLKASCVGCLDCMKGIDCELTILSSSDTVCPITSTCELHHNNIKIEANTQKYGIKAKCSAETIEIQVCENKIEVQISIIDRHEVLEVGNSDQTYFVKEKDMRCGTWLCKVSEQGIGSIFSPFMSIFGHYGRIAFYTVLGLIVFFLAVYILLPVCGRLKDLLKKNEIEYERELRGFKSRIR
ncbi:polyprotein [Enseada virus]|uniref:Envelopment polyprotein n=1 Tax=Enseada virus TaxID=1821545 RepID=A0A142K3J8_9VIRU|nr:polyprotein [Enseada virus]AMR98953.1 polyprotein [Enseada virus]